MQMSCSFAALKSPMGFPYPRSQPNPLAPMLLAFAHGHQNKGAAHLLLPLFQLLVLPEMLRVVKLVDHVAAGALASERDLWVNSFCPLFADLMHYIEPGLLSGKLELPNTWGFYERMSL